jgi:hypothetical protein
MAAENRTTLVHAFNVSTPYDISKSEYERVCDTTELSEAYDPQTTETRLICDEVTTTTVTGYNMSFSISLQHNKESRLVDFISRIFLDKPTGAGAKTDFIRFLKTDLVYGTTDTYFGIRQPCVIAPTEIGGSAEDPLGFTFNVSGDGSAQTGTIKVSVENGKTIYNFEPTPKATPAISSAQNGATLKIGDLIRGNSDPNVEVSIIAEDGEKGKVTAKSNGEWEFEIVEGTGTNGFVVGETYTIAAIVKEASKIVSLPSLKRQIKIAPTA